MCKKMQEIICAHYKRHWRMIYIQIEAINEIGNPKRGFLFDCCAVDHEKLYKVLKNLQNCNLITSEIIVVDLSSDVFLVNKSKFTHNSPEAVLVDISENLNEPKIFESSETIEEELKRIRNQIISHKNESVLKINSSEFSSPPTLYGYLINYPALYFHHQSSDGNCLSYKNLKVFQVIINNLMLLSFTIPESLFNQCDDMRKSINDFLLFYEQKEGCVVNISIANYPRVVL